MKKRYWAIIIFLVALTITYFLGPVPEKPEYSSNLPEIPDSFQKIDSYIQNKEDSVAVRENNEARILWNNGIESKTEYSIIYLHGFAGSYMDGYPVNKNIAEKLGANIFMARWAGHGLKPEEALESFSGQNAWNSAREALAIGKKIGEKVIIMSTSTGGTLAFKLAAEFPDDVFALVNLSPNVEDDQPGTFVLNSPWGYDIARLISFGEMKKIEHEQPEATKYWDTIYPSKALVDLQVLVETTMLPETFQKIECPVLTLYFHKNFIEEDQHVEISVYEDVYKLLGTPDSLKVLKALKTPGTHFIGSDIKSKDTEIVEKSILEFFQDNLKMKIDSNNI